MSNYKETHVFTHSEEDLDVMPPFYTGEEDEDGDPIRNHVETYNEHISEAPSINIDTVIEILMEGKKRGADRVYIGDHCDHFGYEFAFVKAEKL